MTNIKFRTVLVPFLMVSAALFLFSPSLSKAGCDCEKDIAIPPFLSAGADPNVLLMIDNSASMYDLVYTDATDGSSFCFDDTYSSATAYVGYFDTSTWYAYDTGVGWFATTSAVASGGCASGVGQQAYYSGDICILTTGDVIDSFKAKGNFLNWATASKYDIEKYILTGGKYVTSDSAHKHLESEGRGCSGSSFIKQVQLSKSGSATTYYLTLGVGTDEDLKDEINTTLISVFAIGENPFDPSSCQAAIDEMMSENPNFGTIQTSAKDCLEPVSGQGQHEKQALVESLHDCWYLDKHGSWPGGGAQGFNYTKWCEEEYALYGNDPRNIGRDNPAYICYGDNSKIGTDEQGYIGRCWAPGAGAVAPSPKPCAGSTLLVNEKCVNGIVYYCTEWNSGKGECKSNGTWVVRTTGGSAGTSPGWIATGLEDCVTSAREDFCGYITVPQVVDPSDLQTTTGETWNIPAILIGTGATGQLGEPVTTYKALVQKPDEPFGILQEFSTQVRIGAMAFNYDGSRSECDKPEPYVTYACDSLDNKDGAHILQVIGSDDETAGHTDALVAAINNTPADSWTPLAEAMYTAIGYFTQKSSLRLNSSDFFLDTAPITSWCQSNNVLFVTDGASTADLNPQMASFAEQTGVRDEPDDGDTTAGCGDLYGSTYFDDLTYYARQKDIFSGSPYSFDESPKNINTLVVLTGEQEEGGDECSPATLMANAVANGGPNATNPNKTDTVFDGQDPAKLSKALRDAFKDVLQRAAAGSAASVISATRSGEGAVYQAIFWPGIDGPEYGGVEKPDVTWAGEVHSLLMDANGNLFEDTDGSKTLTDVDQRVIFFFDDASDAMETKACYGELENGICSGTVKSLHEVNYLWSAAEWLAGVGDADIDSNRSNYISNEHKRYIFTWNDRDNDGVVDPGVALNNAELLSFEPGVDWSALSVAGTRGAVARDFGVSTDSKTAAQIDSEVDATVNWIRGKDATGMRSREVTRPANFNVTPSINNTITWRLGDVVHSTPTAVSRPAENYHLLYRDMTYVDFVDQYKDRRHMIYFGGNDGMIHAINGGFYNSATKGFCLTSDCSGNINEPELGAEMWGYVPYNLQPQLKCLPDSDYLHRYYVDLKPRVFDVRIFSADDDHPNGWGTILVAGMRFGGNTVDADAAGDARKFTSAYMILDITNPEKPPVLLGELTYDDTADVHMGYTTDVPVVVPMKNGDVTKWYLVFGSGPLWLDGNGDWVSNIAVEGVSNQKSKVAVFPLDTLTGVAGAFRIPDASPAASGAGRYVLADNGFVSDPITMDFDLEQDYRGDAVYFGTVEGGWGNWSGKLYRLVTNADGGMTTPDLWTAPSLMLNTGRPISAAPLVGWDGENYWVYVGTGRFFDKQDKSDASSNAVESYFGIKEPINCSTDAFSWTTVDMAELVNVSPIQVTAAGDAEDAVLSCSTGGTTCLPSGVSSFKDLVSYVAGEGCDDENHATGEAGWKIEFSLDRERNLGQATLLGGLLTFTTYQPFDDICRPEGEAYLYAVYYKTGTSWHEAVFRDPFGETGDPGQVVSKLSIGRGLATTPNLHMGREEGAKAFAQTSTGAIVEIEQPNLPIKDAKTGRMYWRVD